MSLYRAATNHLKNSKDNCTFLIRKKYSCFPIIFRYAAVQDKSLTLDTPLDNIRPDDEEKGNKENQIANGNEDVTELAPPVQNQIAREIANEAEDDEEDEDADESDAYISNSPDTTASTSKATCPILDDEIVISDDEELILDT